MVAPDVLRELARYPVATLCSAHPRVMAMHAGIKPLFPGARVTGPAKTARIIPGHNAAIHRAVHSARAGDVLVVSGGGDTTFGPFGDLLATGCRQRGIQGLVIDSTIRDVAAVRDMGFPVFCLGANPMPTAKSDPGAIDIPITCADVPVRPGDIVVGDDDGVAVLPSELASRVAIAAAAVTTREREVVNRLANGETTYDILGIQADPAGRDSDASPLHRSRPNAHPEFHAMDDPTQGIPRLLAPGVRARIFSGRQAMLSLVTLEPHAESPVHSHPQEQWGVLLEGSGIRIQDGHRIPVEPGRFWRTPGGVPHAFVAGPLGARILDVFSPPRPEYLHDHATRGAP